jgi:two-component system NtrC family sensor kinase
MMKITLKLVLAVLASAALTFAISGYLRAQREVAAFQADMVQNVRLVGQVLEKVLVDAWHIYGRARVSQLIADANASTSQMHFRWLSLDATAAALDSPALEQSHIASLRQGKTVMTTASDARGQPSLYLYVPIVVEHDLAGVLEIAKSQTAVHEYVHQTILRTIIVWGGLVTLSGGLLLLIGVTMIGRPMRRVIEKTRRVGAGDLESPLTFRARDEFAEVAAALNQMCEQLKASQAARYAEMEARLRTLEQLRHADRLKTIGTLVSGIAHELGTPLNVVSGRASLIASGRLAPSDVTDSARIIKEQVQRMAGIIRQLLDFARRKTPARVAVDLRILVQESLDMLAPLAEQQHAVLTRSMDQVAVKVRVDTGQIQQVLINLVTNAWQAMPQGGQIEIGVHGTEDARPPVGVEQPRGRYACVSVADRGAGIPEEDLHRIFDPFFTTKGVGQGTGLGLSVAYGIVRDHGGWIEVTSRLGAGACFSMYLPMEDEPCPDAS